jgi:hypothetical protein
VRFENRFSGSIGWRGVALHGEEPEQRRHEADQPDQRQRRPPARRPALDQAQREQRQRQHAEHLAGRIKSGVGALAGFRQVAVAQPHRQQAHRQVDDEHDAPVGDRHQHAAEDRPRGRGDPGDRPPRADRPRPLGDVRVGRPQQRQRAGDHQGSADPLRDACADQRSDRGRHGARGRCGREQRQARVEHLAGADEVADRSRRQQQAGEHDRVGVDHPLQAADAAAEVSGDRRQRYVHDRRVEDHHEVPKADREQWKVSTHDP